MALFLPDDPKDGATADTKEFGMPPAAMSRSRFRADLSTPELVSTLQSAS
jgi:hypothetical protein